MPQKKPLPVNPSLALQLDLLLHPEHNATGYDAFKDAATYPFLPAATTWSRVNAWWLADASWLAYSHDQANVQSILAGAGLTACTFIDGGGTSGYIAHNNTDLAIVAFRGTQPDDWHDFFDIARLIPVHWDVGRVHQGFADALRHVWWSQLSGALNALPSTCRIWLTGHSLGAALASLTAVRLGSRASGVYTFGAPRIGDTTFAAHFNQAFQHNSIRYVNDHDVVTHVPPEHVLPWVKYAHTDFLRWIDPDGNVGTTQATEHFVSQLFGEMEALLQMVDLAHQPAGFPLPEMFTDHTPLYYALQTWNDFAVNGN